MSGQSILQILAERAQADPFNGDRHRRSSCWPSCTRSPPRVSRRCRTRSSIVSDGRARAAGRRQTPSVTAEAAALPRRSRSRVRALGGRALRGDDRLLTVGRQAKHYFNDEVNYTEALFVVVIMSLAATRPIVAFAEACPAPRRQCRRRNAGRVVGHDPDHRPHPRVVHHRAGGDDDLRAAARRGSSTISIRATRLKYATLGLLFVNVSIGGTLDAFRGAARADGGAALGLVDAVHARALRLAGRARDRRLDADLLRDLPRASSAAWRAGRRCQTSSEPEDRDGVGSRSLPVPWWLTVDPHGLHGVDGPDVRTTRRSFSEAFLIFLGFVRATAAYQSLVELKAPLLVGFFLAGLVIHGGLQGMVDLARALEPVGDAALPEFDAARRPSTTTRSSRTSRRSFPTSTNTSRSRSWRAR